MPRTPRDLDNALRAHKAAFAHDPILLSLNTRWFERNRAALPNLHALCCGRGFLYAGIPTILTTSPFVEDFLIGY